MNATPIKTQEPEPMGQTEKNIAAITNQLVAEGFLRSTDDQRRIFDLILDGRLKGHTPDNHLHSDGINTHYVKNGNYLLCTQCGHEELI